MTDEPDRTAALDQALAGVRDSARFAAAYYSELIKAGVPQQVAMALTGAWIDQLRRDE